MQPYDWTVSVWHNETWLEFKWINTCPACPEQYEVYFGETIVAYVRLRFGVLRVSDDANNVYDDPFYIHDFDDDYKGDFDNDKERDMFRHAITTLIANRVMKKLRMG